MIIIRSGFGFQASTVMETGCGPYEAMNAILATPCPMTIVIGQETFYIHEEQSRRVFCNGIMFATSEQLTNPQSER